MPSSRFWLCNEVGHRAVHCKKRGATQVSASQEKRGASGKAAGVNNVKAEPVQCTRVVIEALAFPLRSVNAKAVCECLLQVFSLVSIPSVITSDNATYFTSQLNDKFMELFGCKPRFSTVFIQKAIL